MPRIVEVMNVLELEKAMRENALKVSESQVREQLHKEEKARLEAQLARLMVEHAEREFDFPKINALKS